MKTYTMKLDRLHRLAANRRPTYETEARNCGTIDGDSITFDRDSECFKKLLEAKEADKPKIDAAPSRGLGDTIAKITSAVGIKPCGGCAKRRAILNKIVPYKQTGE